MLTGMRLVITAVLVAALFVETAQSAEDEYAAVHDTLTSCAACHGENGASTQAQYPILAGQHLYYLYLQLKDFKAGRRENEIMQPIAAALEKDQMMSIAKYFSEQQWPDIAFQAEPEQIKRGQQAVAAGQCVQCHLGGFEGASGVPRLAGAYPEYLKKTMLDFKNGVRKNAPDKSSLLEAFSDGDIDALAAYLGQM